MHQIYLFYWTPHYCITTMVSTSSRPVLHSYWENQWWLCNPRTFLWRWINPFSENGQFLLNPVTLQGLLVPCSTQERWGHETKSAWCRVASSQGVSPLSSCGKLRSLLLSHRVWISFFSLFWCFSLSECFQTFTLYVIMSTPPVVISETSLAIFCLSHSNWGSKPGNFCSTPLSSAQLRL